MNTLVEQNLLSKVYQEESAGDLGANKVNPAFALPELENPTPASLLALQKKLESAQIRQRQAQEISTPQAPKTPAISTISTNFAPQVPKGVIL